MDTQKLVAVLSRIKGAVIVSLHAETEPAMRKTNNPYYGHIIKCSYVNGLINWEYVNSVNNQRLREWSEPTFTATPRQWGQRIQGTPLVEYRGNYYLEVKVQRSTCRYWYNGIEIPLDQLQEYLIQPGKSRQELIKEVILRDYKLESIRSITYGGFTLCD